MVKKYIAGEFPQLPQMKASASPPPLPAPTPNPHPNPTPLQCRFWQKLSESNMTIVFIQDINIKVNQLLTQ